MTKNTKRTISTLSALLTMAILARMVQLIERESAYEQLFRPSSGHVPAGKRKVTIAIPEESENGETVALQQADSENTHESARPLPDVSIEESETIKESERLANLAQDLRHSNWFDYPGYIFDSDSNKWERDSWIIHMSRRIDKSIRSESNLILETWQKERADAERAAMVIAAKAAGLPKEQVYKQKDVLSWLNKAIARENNRPILQFGYQDMASNAYGTADGFRLHMTWQDLGITGDAENGLFKLKNSPDTIPAGRYPDLLAIVPKKSDIVLSVDPVELIQALKQVMIFARDNADMVRLQYNPNNNHPVLFVSAKSNERGDCRVLVNCAADYTSDIFDLSINGKYLTDALSLFSGPVPLRSNGCHNPLQIGTFGQHLAVIMPMGLSREATNKPEAPLTDEEPPDFIKSKGLKRIKYTAPAPVELPPFTPNAKVPYIGYMNINPDTGLTEYPVIRLRFGDFPDDPQEPTEPTGESGANEAPPPEPESTPEPEPAQSCEICGQIAVNHIDDHHLCDSCHIRALDYEDKLQARLARLQDRAEKATKEARAEIDAAHRKADMIPFGQPILVGHHSEKRDRAFRKRIENGYRRGFDALERGKRLQSRADRIEKQQASEDPRRRYNPISSDDPIAIIKLREKIEALEADQERMKFYNVHTRKALKLPEGERMAYLVQTLECKEKTAANMLVPDFAGRYGIPDYALKNNNANIRRLKQRLADMEAEAKARAVMPDVIEEESPVEGLTIQRDTVQNRLQLLFPGKPDDKTRAFLKSCGFRWSPQNKAWQRQLNQSAEWAAQRVIAHLQGEE